MTAAELGSTGKALLVLSLGLVVLASAQAAPLRLSLDGRAASGPNGEPVEPPAASVAPDDAESEGEGAGELSFVVAPDLPLHDVADVVASVDADWLVVARTQQDDASAAADRSLGDFAPAAPAPVAASTDPLDGVTVAADSPDAGARPEPWPPLSTEAPDRSALAWMVVPTITLAASVAWWTGRSRGHRRKRRTAR